MTVDRLDLVSVEKLVDGLAVLFYVALVVAFLTAVMGSPGWGFLFLIVGAFALVARTTTEAISRRPG